MPSTHSCAPLCIHKSSQLHEFLVSSEISILLRPIISIEILGSGKDFVFEICNMTRFPTIAHFLTLRATQKNSDVQLDPHYHHYLPIFIRYCPKVKYERVISIYYVCVMRGYEVDMEVVRKEMVQTSNDFYSLVRTIVYTQVITTSCIFSYIRNFDLPQTHNLNRNLGQHQIFRF